MASSNSRNNYKTLYNIFQIKLVSSDEYNNSDDDGMAAWAIVLITLSCVVIIVVIGVVALYCYKSKKESNIVP